VPDLTDRIKIEIYYAINAENSSLHLIKSAPNKNFSIFLQKTSVLDLTDRTKIEIYYESNVEIEHPTTNQKRTPTMLS
jgi:hypothetical protein